MSWGKTPRQNAQYQVGQEQKGKDRRAEFDPKGEHLTGKTHQFLDRTAGKIDKPRGEEAIGVDNGLEIVMVHIEGEKRQQGEDVDELGTSATVAGWFGDQRCWLLQSPSDSR